MACKVQLEFYDYFSSKYIDAEGCTLTINGTPANGITTQESGVLVFAYSDTIPGGGGYRKYGWQYSLDGGNSFNTSSSDTLTIVAPANSYIVVRARLNTNSFTLTYYYNNGTGSTATQSLTYGYRSTLRSSPTAPSGKVFSGWNIDGVTYTGSAYYTLTEPEQKRADAIWVDSGTAKRTISYYYNNPGHSVSTTQTGAEGTAVELRSSPSYNGYIFDGWDIGGTLYPEYGAYVLGASDVDAEARWTVATKIHYNYSNPSQTDYTDNVKASTVIQLRNAPSYTDHTFSGWEIDGTVYGASAPFTVPANGDVYATALWEEKHKIHYDYANPDHTDNTDSVQTGVETQLRSSPSYQYHTFTGWLIDGTLYQSRANFVMPDYDVYAVAQWKPTVYTLTFSMSGWTPQIDPISGTYEDELTIPSTVPTRSGYTFVSWRINNSYYRPGEKVKLTSNTSASIQYLNSQTITVTFGANSGTFDPGSETSRTVDVLGKYGIKHSESQITQFPVPHREGYDFVGWFDTNSSSGGKQITEESIVSNPSSHTIYARWVQKKRVRFYPNGGYFSDGSGDTVKTIYYSIGDVYSDFPKVLRDGYSKDDNLGWWSTSSSSGGDKYEEGQTVEGTNSLDLYVRWASKTNVTFYARPTSTCTFDDYPGETSVRLPYTTGSAFGTMPTVSRSDMDSRYFDGWYTNDTSLSSRKYDANSIVPTSSLYLYSRWAQVVTFDANGGSFDGGSTTYTGYYFFGSENGQSPYRKYSPLPTPQERTGFEFIGWFTSSSGGSEITESTDVTTSSTRTLYAHWKQTATEVTLRFHANGGTFPDGTETNEITVSIGDSFVVPTPTKDHASIQFFVEGLSPEGSGYVLNPGDTISVDQNYFWRFLSQPDYTAKWDQVFYYTFYAYDGSQIKRISYRLNSWFYRSDAPSVPERTGYYTDGWEPELPEDHSPVIHDKSFTAKYISQLFYITFSDWDGTVLQSDQYAKGDTVTPPQEPTREGYTFSGWSPSNFSPATAPLEVVATYVGDQLSITFNPNGGTWSKDGSGGQKVVQVRTGEKADPGDVPKKDGYIFTGWSPDVSVVTESLTTYAQYVQSVKPQPEPGKRRFGSSVTDYVFVKPSSDYNDNSTKGDPMPIRDERNDGTGKIMRWEDPIYLNEWIEEIKYWLDDELSTTPSPTGVPYSEDRRVDISRLLSGVSIRTKKISDKTVRYLYGREESLWSSFFNSMYYPHNFDWSSYESYLYHFIFNSDHISIRDNPFEIQSPLPASPYLALYGLGIGGDDISNVELRPESCLDLTTEESNEFNLFVDNCMDSSESVLSRGTRIKKKIIELLYNSLIKVANHGIIISGSYVGDSVKIDRKGIRKSWSDSERRSIVEEGPPPERKILTPHPAYDVLVVDGDIYDLSKEPEYHIDTVPAQDATYSNPTSGGSKAITPTTIDVDDKSSNGIIAEGYSNEVASVSWKGNDAWKNISDVRPFIDGSHWEFSYEKSNQVQVVNPDSGPNFSVEGSYFECSEFSFTCNSSSVIRNHSSDGEDNGHGIFLTPVKFFFIISVRMSDGEYGTELARRRRYSYTAGYPSVNTAEVDEYIGTGSEKKVYVPWDAVYDGQENGQCKWKVENVSKLIETALNVLGIADVWKSHIRKVPATISGRSQPQIEWIPESSSEYTMDHGRSVGFMDSSFNGYGRIRIERIVAAFKWIPWPAVGLPEDVDVIN